MTTLEDLYYGNIAPYERYIKHGSREEKILKLLCRNEESLTKNLNNRQKEIFNKFTDCQKELSNITTRQAFADRFSLAVQIMVEVMSCTETEEEMQFFSAVVRLKPTPQKTKKVVFQKTAEKFTEPLKNLTKLLLCVILQTVKDN